MIKGSYHLCLQLTWFSHTFDHSDMPICKISNPRGMKNIPKIQQVIKTFQRLYGISLFKFIHCYVGLTTLYRMFLTFSLNDEIFNRFRQSHITLLWI